MTGGASPEAFEDVGAFVGGNARTGVGDVDDGVVVIGLYAYRHSVAGTAVARRVDKDVAQGLMDPVGVGVDHDPVGDIGIDGETGRVQLGMAGGEHLPRQGTGVDVAGPQGQGRGFGRRQFGEVADDPAEPQGLVVQTGQLRRAGPDQPVPEFLETGLQTCQWRAKFVRDVGGQSPAGDVGALQFLGHVVAGVTQLAAFAGRTHLGARGEVPGGQGECGGRTPDQRPGEPASHVPAHRGGGGHRRSGGSNDPRPRDAAARRTDGGSECQAHRAHHHSAGRDRRGRRALTGAPAGTAAVRAARTPPWSHA